jgi:hypothetical protein
LSFFAFGWTPVKYQYGRLLHMINEIRERLESTGNCTKQLGLITEMEEKYNLQEGILLSHY